MKGAVGTRRQRMQRRWRLERREIERQLSFVPKFEGLEVLHRHQSSPPQIIFSVWKGNDPVGNNEELIIPRSAVTSLFTWENERPACPDGRFYGEYKDSILKLVSSARAYLGQDPQEPSFSDKLWIAYDLAVDLCYVPAPSGGNLSEVRDTAELFGEETSHRLWAYVDGLMEKYHEDRMSGRCSVAASMAYDPEMEERKVDADISLFKILKASIEGIDDSIPPPDLMEIQQDAAASPGA